MCLHYIDRAGLWPIAWVIRHFGIVSFNVKWLVSFGSKPLFWVIGGSHQYIPSIILEELLCSLRFKCVLSSFTVRNNYIFDWSTDSGCGRMAWIHFISWFLFSYSQSGISSIDYLNKKTMCRFYNLLSEISSMEISRTVINMKEYERRLDGLIFICKIIWNL